MQNNTNNSPVLEITVISAQGLKTSSSVFSKRLRPFITLSASADTAVRSGKHMKMYKTRVDDGGGVNPTWGDKFHLCLDHTFFYQRYPGVYLQLYTKHLLMGKVQLGWCCIPAADFVSCFAPVGSTQFLSYQLRDKDGTRGHGVVNVSVRLGFSFSEVHSPGVMVLNNQHFPEKNESDRSVIGIPVTNLFS